MLGEQRVLILPGWRSSGPGHWQTRWEALHGFERVEQADWHWPRRGDWMARLDEVVLSDSAPALLVAHSLGCHLVAAWAAHTQNTQRVRAALLVAPPDGEREGFPPQLTTWRTGVRRRLPFPAQLLYSDDDPFCDPGRALQMAQDWGAAAHSVGAAGHINGDSDLADWPVGLAHLHALARRPQPAV
jgi:predicted alpha/beta hydrolase family esterase